MPRARARARALARLLLRMYEHHGESARYTSYWKTIMRVLTVALPSSTAEPRAKWEIYREITGRRERRGTDSYVAWARFAFSSPIFAAVRHSRQMVKN